MASTGNTFNTSGQQFPLVDPRGVRENRKRFRRDYIHELDRANSYYSMAGRWPDVGWFLLDRASYSRVNPYATNLSVSFNDFVNPPLTVSNLTVVQARCVTRGLANDPNAIYLVQVTNSQGILYNPWFQFPLDAQYNIRVPAYDTQFYSWSMNGGTTWTWDTMIGDMWAKAPNELGAYPHLPITPAGTPENFSFIGTDLWESISRLMEYLGLAVSGSYPNFTIVVPGAADAAFAALSAKYGPAEDDLEYLDAGSGRIPGSVIVHFRRRNHFYGTEETVRYDTPQWLSTPLYQVTVNAPPGLVGGVGVASVMTDFTVRFDQNGVPLPADVTMANTIAQDRAVGFFNTIYRGTQGFMRRVYGGVVPFNTGSLVDGVRWYNTGYGDEYCGWRTEIIRGYSWEEVTFPLTLMGLTGPT